MTLRDKLKFARKTLKIVTYCGGSLFFVAYHIRRTYASLNKIVNPQVLDREKKHHAEYIYIDDPSYDLALRMEQDKKSTNFTSLLGIWKSLRHTLAWRLLWLCRHGNSQQRNIALDQLASFKNNKHWDCLKLAQAMDKHTGVLLARTRDADLRYFLPPPLHVRRAALTSELLSFKFRDMITAIQNIHPHSCIEHFLCKYFANVQEQAMEADSIPAKPDSISEHDLCILCLDALHHHISLFYENDYVEDSSTRKLIHMGLLPKLAELILRYPADAEIDFSVLRVLTILSIHCDLLKDFFESGLVRDLSRLVRSKDIRLASSAAVCLSNLSGDFCYKPGLYLLHPLFRTRTRHTCDTLLVHGLRGGVFVTWRQRDKKCAQPIGIIEVTISNTDCDPCEDKTSSQENPYLDPELKEVIENLKELEEHSLLSDFEVVLHDIPIQVRRDEASLNLIANEKQSALAEEVQDGCNHTNCWPKEWLPKDCDNLRILGVNYWSSLSEWLEKCPLQTAEISVRAAELAPSLIDAGVGNKHVPVVWLTHSMGGLIVKQMLIEAAKSEDEEVKKLCDNTKAVVFYSTPHKGSAFANMPRAAAAVFWPSNDVRQLQENSPTLLQLHQSFIKYADQYGWETISFAETLPTLITAFKVPVTFVQSESADLGRGVFYELPLDHLSICKPATRQSILYTTVLDVINRVTANEPEHNQKKTFISWLMDLIWWIFAKKAFEMVDTTEEPINNDGLKWFEKMLLDTFTDF